MRKTIQCAAFGTNANGDTDIFFCKVNAEEEQIENGYHYDAIKDKACEYGYEPYLACDEDDPAGAVMQLAEWQTMETITI